MGESFGSLRSALHETPSHGAWREVCRIIEEWGEGQGVLHEAAIPYARDILDDWPPALITIPDWTPGLPGFLPAESRAWVGLVRAVRGAILHASAWVEAIEAAGGRVDLLETSGPGSRDLALRVARSPELAHLCVSEGLLDAAFVRALASLELPALEVLELRVSSIGDEGCHALARAPWVGGLRRLALSQGEITGAGVASLAGAPHAHLEHLDLSGNALDDAALVALARDGVLPAVTSLDLGENRIRDEGALALEESELARRLETLDLSYNQIGPRIVAMLERSEYSGPEAVVDLSENTPPDGYVDPEGDFGVDEIEWRGWERADDLDEWETWTTWKRNKG